MGCLKTITQKSDGHGKNFAPKMKKAANNSSRKKYKKMNEPIPVYMCRSCGHKSRDGIHSCPGLIFNNKPIAKSTKLYAAFELGDGSIYGYPLERIAHDRATYYAKNDPKTTYEREFEFVMEDDYEGIDWLQNNMNPKDEDFVIIQHATKSGIMFRINEELEDSYICEN